MTKEEQQRFDALALEVDTLSKLFSQMLKNQERFAHSLTNILDYMETHKLTMQPYRPNKLDS